MKKILVIATGGTIVCSDEGGGLRPHYSVYDLLESIGPDKMNLVVEGTTVMNIDSSNMTPGCWLQIAGSVLKHQEQYDGFVITHGTDTMAYTAAALSYLLHGLDRPVVLTGAQYSMADMKTDAIQNLHDSLLVAAEKLCGVLVVFDGRVINGTRAIKTKTRSYDAFESVNYPLVAEIKHNRIRYNPLIAKTFTQPVKPATDSLILPQNLVEDILILKLFPGLQPKVFDFVRDNFKGIIIESYGTGGISTDRLDLAAKVRELADNGLIIGVTTQCLKEGVDLQIYEVGRKLPLEKIIYARDMNTEAMVAKMMWAMARSESFSDIKQIVETPIQDDLLLEERDILFD